MLNLLLISNHPKVLEASASLQKMLKTRVDSTNDFDLGMKYIFDKRPSVVFIQDSISGVSCSSIISHFQMMLGANAPLFVVLQENPKNSLVGRHDHSVDLNLSQTDLLESMVNILKKIEGDKWSSICNDGDSLPSVPEASVSGRRLNPDMPSSGESDGDISEKITVVASEIEPDFSAQSTGPLQKLPVAGPAVNNVEETLHAIDADLKPAGKPVRPAPDAKEAKKKTASPAVAKPSPAEPERRKIIVQPPREGGSTVQEPVPGIGMTPSAASVTTADDDHIHVSILSAIEGANRKRLLLKRAACAAAFLLLCAAVASWYFSRVPQKMSKGVEAAAPAVQVQEKPKETASVNSVQTQPVPVPKIPSFVPVDSRDREYSGKNPGWERYVSAAHEFRVYTENNTLKALQVFSRTGEPLKQELLKKALSEMTGAVEYKVVSREKKKPYDVERSVSVDGSDLAIYYSGRSMRAFAIVKAR